MAVNKILYLDLVLLTFLYVVADNGYVNNTAKCPVNKFIRKQVPAEPLNGMCMGDVATYLSKALHSIVDKELDVSSFQEMINDMEFANIADSLDIQLSLLVDKFNNKLRLLFDILKQSYSIIYPVLSKRQDQSVYFHNQVEELDIIPKRMPDICAEIVTALGTYLKDQKWKDLHVLPISQPSTICGPSTMVHNIGPLLLSHYCPQKSIILLLDTCMSEPDLSLTQLTAKTIIDMLSETDHISVASFGNSIPLPCNDSLLKATDINKFQLIRYIDSLTKLDVNQTMNVDFRKLTQSVRGEIIVIHLTNKLIQASNVQRIYEIISEKSKTYLKTIVIRSKPHSSSNKEPLNNDTIILPTQNVLGYEIGKLFSCLQCPYQQKKDYYILDPYFEPYSKSMMLSVGQITSTAILSLDVKLSDFLDDLTYFNAGPNVHVIVFDSKGIVWLHKDFPRVERITEQPLKVHLQDIENIDNQTVMKMISDVQGIVDTKTKLGDQKWYRWKRSIYEDLTICVTSTTEEGMLPVARIVPSLPKNILHYRLDLMVPNQDKDIFCIYRNRILTLSTGVVYLSSWCFQSPMEQLKLLENGSAMTIQSYMAYIKDVTRLLANPGLRPSVKPDVAILAQILENFKEQHSKSSINKFVLRRYGISTSSGALEIFPGMVLDSSFDPKRRMWYGKALEYPDKIILTPPYLDAAGSGYVVTLSRAIRYSVKESNKSADYVIAVVSMDVTMSYISRLLLDTFPFCAEATVRCFLMDDKGYLISHPTFLETTDKTEQHHLTHKEILIANDVLNHELFVKKQLCINYLDGTVRRYYQFNMSLDEVLTNIAHGEHCVKYQIAAVSGINMFLGIINMTTQCNHLRAFCPCSTMDHSCLNCKSMEQTGCECPCECPLYSSTCLQQNIDNLRSCQPPYEQGASSQTLWLQSENLHSCPIIDCKSYTTERDCLGIADCQWCHVESDGETPLQQPFCSDLSVCFKGIFGSFIPYSSYNSQSTTDITLRDWSSVGPVAGGILAVVLTLGIILFCYKLRSMHSSLEHQCLHVHMSPDTLRTTHIEGDPELQTESDRSKKNMGCLVQNGVAPISPYRVSTNYRRPPGCDSDHGYSTMTPHDDFEQQPFASEPLLVIGDNQIEPDLNKQSTIELSSPTTHLESSHHVLVPVTVHRDMETNYC